MMANIDEPGKHTHDLALGRIYLPLSARMTLEQIAEIAGATEAEVLRLIKLAEADAAKK